MMSQETQLLQLQKLKLEVEAFGASSFKAQLVSEINQEYLTVVQQSQAKECDPHDMKWLVGRASGIVFVLSLMNSMKARTEESIANINVELEEEAE